MLVVATWLAALAGAGLIASDLVARDAAPPAPAPVAAAPQGADAQLGQRIRTSFGSMSVDYVYRMVGSKTPMGVRTRGAEIPLQVGVSVINLSKKPLPVDRSLLTLRDGRGRLVTGRLPGGRIGPLRQHRLTLRYAVPAGAQLPLLEIRDPAGGEPTTVALGPTKGLYELDVRTHLPRRP
jgi:hypothetical protein